MSVLEIWERVHDLKIAFGAFLRLGHDPILFSISNFVVVQIFMLFSQFAQYRPLRGLGYYTNSGQSCWVLSTDLK